MRAIPFNPASVGAVVQGYDAPGWFDGFFRVECKATQVRARQQGAPAGSGLRAGYANRREVRRVLLLCLIPPPPPPACLCPPRRPGLESVQLQAAVVPLIEARVRRGGRGGASHPQAGGRWRQHHPGAAVAGVWWPSRPAGLLASCGPPLHHVPPSALITHPLPPQVIGIFAIQAMGFLCGLVLHVRDRLFPSQLEHDMVMSLVPEVRGWRVQREACRSQSARLRLWRRDESAPDGGTGASTLAGGARQRAARAGEDGGAPEQAQGAHCAGGDPGGQGRGAARDAGAAEGTAVCHRCAAPVTSVRTSPSQFRFRLIDRGQVTSCDAAPTSSPARATSFVYQVRQSHEESEQTQQMIARQNSIAQLHKTVSNLGRAGPPRSAASRDFIGGRVSHSGTGDRLMHVEHHDHHHQGGGAGGRVLSPHDTTTGRATSPPPPSSKRGSSEYGGLN